MFNNIKFPLHRKLRGIKTWGITFIQHETNSFKVNLVKLKDKYLYSNFHEIEGQISLL